VRKRRLLGGFPGPAIFTGIHAEGSRCGTPLEFHAHTKTRACLAYRMGKLPYGVPSENLLHRLRRATPAFQIRYLELAKGFEPLTL
jgi:hypothetical protein